MAEPSDNVEEVAELVRKAKTVKHSVWYRMQENVLMSMEYPTLRMVMEIIDGLAIYSADAGRPSSGDPRSQDGSP